MSHHATPDFWACYRELPAEIQALADKSFALLKDNPKHLSLHFKKVGRFWSARVGAHHRALAVEGPDGLVWFWIGVHREYAELLANNTLERTMEHRGPRLPAARSLWPAAQLDR